MLRSPALVPPIAALVTAAACLVPATRHGDGPGKLLAFTILEDYDKGDDLAEVDRDFQLFQDLGITTWRGSFGWDDYEPERGRFDFAWLHQFIERAAGRGIALRPYVGYTPGWAAGGADRDHQVWNQPPRDQRDWESFIEALTRELAHHPNVKSLEIYNEENVAQWWEGSPADYGATLISARRASRAPRLPLVMGGLVFADVDWIESVCGLAGTSRAFDVIAVHAYPETWTPPGVTVENYFGESFQKDFLPTADDACGRKPVWINETGFATTPGKSERDQANWWARAIATFAAQPRVEQIGVYEIKDLRPDRPAIGDAPNYHLGLAYPDRRRKLAFSTVRLLAGLLRGSRIRVADSRVAVRLEQGAGEIHQHLFVRPDGDGVLVIWDRTGDSTVRVSISGDWRRASELALDGTSLEGKLPLPDFRAGLRAGVPRIFRLARATGSGG